MASKFDTNVQTRGSSRFVLVAVLSTAGLSGVTNYVSRE